MDLRDILKYREYFKNYYEQNKEPKIHTEVTKEGHQTMPSFVKDRELNDFVTTFYDSDALHPKYKDYLEERDIEVHKIDDYTIYSKEELLAILTFMVRADRFTEGYLIKRARKGYIYQILKNLEKFI